MAKAPTPQAIVEGFLLRARRVMAHSLIRDQAELMEKLHSGSIDVAVTVNTKTGEETYRIKAEYPAEEAMESLASRVRPLILGSDPIYYAKVLDALAEVVGVDRLNEEVDLAWWHEYWREVIDANRDAQAYLVRTANGSVTDRKLMYAWLYGDVVHATAPRSPVIRELSIDERYQAAAQGVSRICDRVIYTAIMLKSLMDKGLLSVSPEVMTDDVVVTSTVLDKEVKAYVAPVETPLPDNILELDPAVWKSIHETLSEDEDGSVTEDLAADEQSETEDGGAATA